MGFRSENPTQGTRQQQMALYSFNHDTFGKTTNKAGAAAKNAAYNAREGETRLSGKEGQGAAANAAYNAREEATFAVRSHVIPPEPDKAEAWFREQEKGERKNARMSDRFIGALPRELTPEQCIEAVERFCKAVTRDRVPWHFALHLELDKKGDADWNPHAHIIIRDRDIETGKRVLYTSAGPKERAQLAEKGVPYWTTKDFREAWGAEMNRALERAGHDVRIDHRSLKEQGIDRTPTIHEGPKPRRMEQKGIAIASKEHNAGNRTVLYPLMDEGSRPDFNRRVMERNARRALVTDERRAAEVITGQPRKPTPATETDGGALARTDPQTRAVQEALAKKREELRAEHKTDRAAMRQLHASEVTAHRAWAQRHYRDTRQAAFEAVGQQFAGKWEAVWQMTDKTQQQAAAAALRSEQAATYKQLSDQMMQQARAEKAAKWATMKAAQAQARRDMRDDHKAESTALAREAITQTRALRDVQTVQREHNAGARLAAQMSGKQSMPQVQAAQMRLMQQRAADAARAKAQPQPERPPDEPRKSPAEMVREASARAAEQAAKRDRRSPAELVREASDRAKEQTDRRQREASKGAAEENWDGLTASEKREVLKKHGRGDSGRER